MVKKIIVTGGTGRFGSLLQKMKTRYKMFFPGKGNLDITKYESVKKYIKLKKTQHYYSFSWFI